VIALFQAPLCGISGCGDAWTLFAAFAAFLACDGVMIEKAKTAPGELDRHFPA
jgi:hypothetical protein